MSKNIKTTPKKLKQEPEVQDARVRLRGALNDSINLDDGYDSNLPQRGRPSKKLLLARQQTQRLLASLPPAGSPESDSTKVVRKYNTTKRRAILTTQKPPSESFVMKLFDRSLDLSKYTEKTPLYPICRAWMANQPRNPSISNYSKEQSVPVKREDNAAEVLEKLQKHETFEVTAMPLSSKTDLSPIPKALELSQEQLEESRKLEGSSKSALMADHLKRWRAAKSHWIQHSKKYDQARYGAIHKIMDKLYRG